MSELIEFTRHGRYAVLRLAREAKRNALNREMRDATRTCLQSLDPDVRVVVVTGTGGSFCSGLDLKERELEKAAGKPDTAGDEWIDVNALVHAHAAIFVAAVNGLTLGAGLTFLNSCDLAIAAQSAQIGCPEIGFATYASMSGPSTQLTIARRHAAWLLLTAQRIDAATAERWGLVNEVVADDQLMPRARALAEHIAQFDAVALREVKKALHHVPAEITDWRAAMEYGQTVNQAIRRETSAAAKGLQHFAQGGRNPGQG
jgi:enoyl-CoA hydratase/carnithine racemase